MARRGGTAEADCSSVRRTAVLRNRFFKYDGDWRLGRRHGRGTLHFADGGYILGTWVDGELTGNPHGPHPFVRHFWDRLLLATERVRVAVRSDASSLIYGRRHRCRAGVPEMAERRHVQWGFCDGRAAW